MKKLLAAAVLSVLPLTLISTVSAQGFNDSPRGASAGDASGPGPSKANKDGASSADIMNSHSSGTKSEKQQEGQSEHATQSSTPRHNEGGDTAKEMNERGKAALSATPSTPSKQNDYK